MILKNWPSWCLFVLLAIVNQSTGADDDYNIVDKSGAFEFGYNAPDSYHHAKGTRNNVVRGEFGGRNPQTGAIDSTVYTAGPRGYRPRGKNIHRKYDLNQNGPRAPGSRDDPYYDPFEDPSYSFGFRTATYSRQENQNRVGDVAGKYTYRDDVGEVHNVEYIAGKNTGFHVKTPFPDSNPSRYGTHYFRGRGKPLPRGRTSIQRELDGSYKFVSVGPDQRRTEISDGVGHVRGSYTYLDDKGVQHSVHYIAGPETGYRVLKNVKGPHLPTLYPFQHPGVIPGDFYDDIKDVGDVFNVAETSFPKPEGVKPGNKPGSGAGASDGDGLSDGFDIEKGDLPGNLGNSGSRPIGSNKPSSNRPPSGTRPPRPSYDLSDYDDSDGDAGIFDDKPASSSRPPASGKPTPKPGGNKNDKDDGSYKPSDISGEDDDGSYFPPGDPNQDDGQYKPGSSSSSNNETPRPGLGADNKPRPRPPVQNKPSYNYDDGDDSHVPFLVSESSHVRPPIGGVNTIIQVQGGSNGNGPPPPGCERCKGTIVTNLGDKLFSVPPGVSVRAHVQSIDLLPILSKVPSPADQFKEETSIKTEQLNSAASNLISNTTEKSAVDTSITTTIPPTTTSAGTTQPTTTPDDE